LKEDILIIMNKHAMAAAQTNMTMNTKEDKYSFRIFEPLYPTDA
jgi:hypothetical protein